MGTLLLQSRPVGAILVALVLGTLGACAEADPRTSPAPDAGGTGGEGGGSGGVVTQGDGDGDGDGDTGQPDAATSCRPNPEADPACPEICPEACNDADDDCDGVVDEGADDTACAVANATSICTRGLCILSACDGGFRDCDSVRENGCEVDIATPDNCGACGITCEYDNTAAVCVDGVCEPGECVEPYLDCDGEDGLCETFAETLTDCGDCGASCEAPPRATPICMDGACMVDECLGNFGDCNDDATDGCELPLNTPAHCGGCGIPCAFAGSSANCDGGACVIEACSPGYADCDGNVLSACDSLDTDDHCGGCGRQCTVDALDNVTTAGCAARSCVVSCVSGFGDCDGEPTNGCETPLTGVNNCTGCGVACVPDHAVGDCGGGSCQVGMCDAGWADCDGDPDNGCETNTGRPENCGGCGIQCQVSPPIGCNGDICAGVLCPEDQADCDGNDTCEADLSSDATCGSCGVQCAFDGGVDGHGSIGCSVENSTPGQLAWGCEVSCTDGFADCDGDYRNGCEVDLTDLNNCGGCGNVCTKTRAAPTCENRVCEVGSCDLDWGDCDNDDLDCETQLNSANDCGTCGNGCDFPFAASACGGSPGNRACIIQQCVPVEHESCDGDTDTGCEADTRNDPLNCNGCGNDCTTGPQVQGGNCIDSACSYSCAPNYRDCTGSAGCETNLLAAGSCGDCNNDCLALPEVTSANCQPGGGNPVCEITGCDGGFGDCNGDPGDGCEEPTNTSEAHCGACSGEPGNQPCENLTGVGSSTCGAGLCVIGSCTGNLEDCNRVSSDGCEWDPAVDGMCCDPNMDDDGDGSDNCADGCPTDPGKVTPGVCGCFVADTDSDGDGAENCIEDCDNDPGKTVPGTCGCGTADVDGDGDSFLVCEESCDGDPLKQDPGQCGCGVSELEYPACIYTRKALTIQGSQVPSAQSDFPVLVRITDAELQAGADASGLDIYFEDDQGTALAFERESYDSGSGALVAWVRMGLTGADQVFYIYYDDDDLTEKSNPAGVWTNGYENVWHLTQDPGPGGAGNILDSTGTSHATAHSSMTSNDLVDAPIGKGIDFDGSNDRLSYTNRFAGSGASTISAWVNQPNDGDNNSVISFGTPGSNQVRYLFSTHDSTSTIRVGFNPNAVNTDDGIESLGWKLVTWVWNSGNTEVFLDGASVYGPVSHTGANTSGTGGRLGANVLDNVFLDGILDEVHLSTTVRSAEWIATEYNNQRPGSTFLTVGPEL